MREFIFNVNATDVVPLFFNKHTQFSVFMCLLFHRSDINKYKQICFKFIIKRNVSPR